MRSDLQHDGGVMCSTPKFLSGPLGPYQSLLHNTIFIFMKEHASNLDYLALVMTFIGIGKFGMFVLKSDAVYN